MTEDVNSLSINMFDRQDGQTKNYEQFLLEQRKTFFTRLISYLSVKNWALITNIWIFDDSQDYIFFHVPTKVILKLKGDFFSNSAPDIELLKQDMYNILTIISNVEKRSIGHIFYDIITGPKSE